MLHLLHRLYRTLTSSQTRPQRTSRPTLTRLEDRDCPTAIVSPVVNGVVTVTVNDSSAGYYGGQYVYVSRGYDLIAINGSYVTKPSGQYLKVSELRKLTIIGSNRDNTIDLSAVTRDAFGSSGLQGRIFVEGRGGNDVIYGSAFTDQIFGGNGHDILRGGDGNDLLHGGDGNDLVVGGRGNDVLFGGWGTDYFVGDLEVISPDYVQPNHGQHDWLRDRDAADYYLWTGGLHSRQSAWTQTRPAWDIEYGVPGKPSRPLGRSVDLYGFEV